MDRTRAFIVDDSPLIRRVVTDALQQDAEIEVIGTATDGVDALRQLPEARPDVIILDVDMPRMNGLDTLRAIRQDLGKVPVIMFSNMTMRGADETLEALSLGANDYITKPANLGSVQTTKDAIREALCRKIRTFCVVRRDPGGAAVLATPRGPKAQADQRIDAVCVGISTGGPPALQEVFGNLQPADVPVPVMVVQHMPPLYTRSLANRLDELSALTIREAEDGMVPAPGHVYIAPGHAHLVVTRRGARRVLELSDGPEVHSCRPSADVLFASMAEAYGGRVLGVVMTGMGSDGLDGSRQIRDAGGTLLAQDQASSAVWGMPAGLVREGLVSQPTPLGKLASEVARLLAEHR